MQNEKIVIYIFLVLVSKNVLAQEYIREGKNRLNFAKTYLELGGQYSPSFKGATNRANNSVHSFENSASIVPYINIGGLHFWGHGDFYISIPLSQINFSKNDSTNFTLNQSVVTGARFLPWAYKDKRLRPFVGASWAVVNFKQENKLNNGQPLFSKNKLIFDAGLLYGNGSFMTRYGVNFYPTNNWNYPISQTNFQNIKTPNWSAYFGLVYAFESTRSKNMETENTRLNKFPKTSSPTMNAIKKGDWFIGIGPSTSFLLAKSDYNTFENPFFNQKPISNTYFDIAVGYQFNKKGIVAALSYRNPTFTNEAFGVKQTIKKNSIVFEAYKYLTDYSGFTPYVGLNIAYDNVNFTEKSSVKNIATKTNILTPGITFGWDILPGKTEQWFVLRTNLRWFPFEKFEVNNKAISLHKLEYNVIQAVFYPSRLKNAKRKRD